MESCDLFTHIIEGCITDPGAIQWTAQGQQSNREEYK